jgi:hypothetical protein
MSEAAGSPGVNTVTMRGPVTTPAVPISGTGGGTPCAAGVNAAAVVLTDGRLTTWAVW